MRLHEKIVSWSTCFYVKQRQNTILLIFSLWQSTPFSTPFYAKLLLLDRARHKLANKNHLGKNMRSAAFRMWNELSKLGFNIKVCHSNSIMTATWIKFMPNEFKILSCYFKVQCRCTRNYAWVQFHDGRRKYLI